jgi:N-acetylglucosamine kinase-like BadF-type ATPase
MYVLGIDAGGTKTLAYLAGEDGAVLGEGRGGGANLQAQGELDVEKVLHGVIEAALGDRAIGVDAVCLGMAGVDRAEDRATMLGILRRLGFRRRALVVNDALVALVAGVGEAPGVVVVSGTGAIAYGVNPAGYAARAGGWGYVIGDEGSSYWIGRQALAAVVRDADGRGPQTRLSALALEHYGVPHVPALVRAVYDTGLRKQAIAGLGPIVDRARAEGDIVASDILRLASEELVRAASSVIERLEMRGDVFRIVLAGGTFGAIPWLADDVARRLADVAPRATATLLEVEPARGAVQLALRAARGEVRVPPYLDAAAGPT